MNNDQLVFCNIDEQGRFIEIYHGVNIIPRKPYRYFFIISKDIKLDDLIPAGITLAELEQWQNEHNAS